ncbi:hypothetical protein QUF90_24295 [Desulfococcaceae bacterium HSG9]|nr:hypothetical protein [Desulfococcaceae bacterium HSG9]
METWLDKLWIHIMDMVIGLKTLADFCMAPLNPLGPVTIIILIAFLTAAITKLLSGKIKTKRLRETEKKYLYWFNLRQEAMKCEDPEKAKLLAKNIDKAELNKAYYDFFFEGFLLSIATRYLPILIISAYINEAYRSERLLTLYGRDYLIRIGASDGDPILISALFGYIIALILVYCIWFVVKKLISSRSGETGNESS